MTQTMSTSRHDRSFQDAASNRGAAIAEKASELADKAGETIDNAVDTAASSARSLAEQGRDASQRVNEVAGNMKTAVDKSLSDQPMTTLAIAAALGFVLGAVWKS